jgi:hypothetical protein
MDNWSTEWADGILEVALAMNTQIHSTIGCAPAELLFRERSSFTDWLNRHARKDPNVGVMLEDRTQDPIFALCASPPAQTSGSRVDSGIYSDNSDITTRFSPDISGSEINVRITPPPHSSPMDEWFDIDTCNRGIKPTNADGNSRM